MSKNKLCLLVLYDIIINYVTDKDLFEDFLAYFKKYKANMNDLCDVDIRRLLTILGGLI